MTLEKSESCASTFMVVLGAHGVAPQAISLPRYLCPGHELITQPEQAESAPEY
jgi:hypothetical protein